MKPKAAHEPNVQPPVHYHKTVQPRIKRRVSKDAACHAMRAVHLETSNERHVEELRRYSEAKIDPEHMEEDLLCAEDQLFLTGGCDCQHLTVW